MSLADRIKYKAEQAKPRVSECVIFARPLPLIADEKPPAGDDYRFKCVFDPTDRHLAQIETPERLELMKAFFARGGFVMLAIHIPTDTAVSKMWLLTFSPLPSDAKRGLLPIKLARDECFILDIWTHPDHRRNAVAFTVAYEIGAALDRFYPEKRWVYGYAHKENEASRGLMELVYGMWAVQEIKEVEVGPFWVNVVPGSDTPKFGPFSKKGRHSGDGFQMPGRPRSGDLARDYHHKEGFAVGRLDAEVADDWMWVGPEWFDNDHPTGSDGRPATPETLRREWPGDAEQAS
ncbi:MAG: hypothetical protein ACOYOP_01595 [Microthrixaceae bacterium]